MKRKRIPKKITDEISSNPFGANKIDPTPDDTARGKTNEKTLNTWEMKQDSPDSAEGLNSEKTLNTWEMTQSPAEELADTEDGTTPESEGGYTESDSDSQGYQFI